MIFNLQFIVFFYPHPNIRFSSFQVAGWGRATVQCLNGWNNQWVRLTRAFPEGGFALGGGSGCIYACEGTSVQRCLGRRQLFWAFFLRENVFLLFAGDCDQRTADLEIVHGIDCNWMLVH